MLRFTAALWTMGIALVCTPAAGAETKAAPAPASPVKFVMHRIGTFRSEACGVADFNGDGKLDIVAGSYLYLAPDWKARRIHPIEGDVKPDGKGYDWDFMDAPLDVDGDGRIDVVSCSWFTKRLDWYRNTTAAQAIGRAPSPTKTATTSAATSGTSTETARPRKSCPTRPRPCGTRWQRTPRANGRS